MTVQDTPTVRKRLDLRTRLANWKEVIDTCQLAEDRPMDAISRWLIISRACVFQMTLTSGVIGGALAAASSQVNWFYLAVALIGLLVAHSANNMINDYFDLRGGVDTDEYVRAQYGPHPVLAGLTTKGGLRNAILAVNAVDALIALYLFSARGWPVLLFAGLGLFISVFYVAPPLRLKHHGLGELGVFLVWGPLMIGGTYYVAAGALPTWVLLVSVPYALVVTTVLIGKHIDKYEADRERGIRTLPVILGEMPSLRLNQALMALFYLVIGAMVALRITGPWVLLSLLAVPRLVEVVRTYNEPKPDEPPEDYPVWPLWFVSWAFYHNKRAGTFFVLGLILNALVPISL